jgi:FkbM family methyltransferase
MIWDLVCRGLRPLMISLPRGSGRLLRWMRAGAKHDDRWSGLRRPYRVFYDPAIEAYVHCDLTEWGGRQYYFTGRYYDPAQQHLIRALLEPGDTFVDIGANLGIHSLLAAHQVGPRGRVYAFEPNPATYGLLSAHLALNHRDNVTAQNLGFSDRPGSMRLSSSSRHSGGFTLRTITEPQLTFDVPVSVGDLELEAAQIGPLTLLKIDVEGWEFKVLKGLSRTLDRKEVAVITEVTPQWLREQHTSSDDLYSYMKETHGFRAYEFTAGGGPLSGRRLQWKHATEPQSFQSDVLFARDGSMAAERLRSQ